MFLLSISSKRNRLGVGKELYELTIITFTSSYEVTQQIIYNTILLFEKNIFTRSNWRQVFIIARCVSNWLNHGKIARNNFFPSFTTHDRWEGAFFYIYLRDSRKEWEGMKDSKTRQLKITRSTLTQLTTDCCSCFSILLYGQGNSISLPIHTCSFVRYELDSLAHLIHPHIGSSLSSSTTAVWEMRKRNGSISVDDSSLFYLGKCEDIFFERIALCITNGICILLQHFYDSIPLNRERFERSLREMLSTGTTRKFRMFLKLNNLTFNLQFP